MVSATKSLLSLSPGFPLLNLLPSGWWLPVIVVVVSDGVMAERTRLSPCGEVYVGRIVAEH